MSKRRILTAMFTVALVALSVALFAGMKYGAEDRPGFDERRPLA